MPKTETALAIRMNLLRDSADPKVKKSSTDSAAPKRAKLLKERDDPKCTISKTDNENREPTRAKPSIDICAPTRR
jgi:hypothetical protein